jgi:hypothetical protein
MIGNECCVVSLYIVVILISGISHTLTLSAAICGAKSSRREKFPLYISTDNDPLSFRYCTNSSRDDEVALWNASLVSLLYVSGKYKNFILSKVIT